MRLFETRFLREADEFMSGLHPGVIRKIFYNIELAEQTNDPRVFKKLHSEIWELAVIVNRHWTKDEVK
jgi:hypothetical protein